MTTSLYGVPTALSHSRLTAAIAHLKGRADVARSEVVTGRRDDLPGVLGADTGAAQLLRKSISDVAVFKSAVANALARSGAAHGVLARASEGVAALAVSFQSALGFGDENTIAVNGAAARIALDGAVAAFNTRFEDRALFSGDAVDRLPFGNAGALLDDVRALYASSADAAAFDAALDAYFDDPAGGFATTFYQGGDGEAARVEIADGELIEVSVRGDEPAIRNLLRGLASLAVAAESAPSDLRDGAIASGAATLLSASDNVAALRADLGAAEQRAAAREASLDAEEAALLAVYNDRTARDPFEAAAELRQIEAQLEASYVMTARISQLSLVNYIR